MLLVNISKNKKIMFEIQVSFPFPFPFPFPVTSGSDHVTSPSGHMTSAFQSPWLLGDRMTSRSPLIGLEPSRGLNTAL